MAYLWRTRPVAKSDSSRQVSSRNGSGERWGKLIGPLKTTGGQANGDVKSIGCGPWNATTDPK